MYEVSTVFLKCLHNSLEIELLLLLLPAEANTHRCIPNPGAAEPCCGFLSLCFRQVVVGILLFVYCNKMYYAFFNLFTLRTHLLNNVSRI